MVRRKGKPSAPPTFYEFSLKSKKTTRFHLVLNSMNRGSFSELRLPLDTRTAAGDASAARLDRSETQRVDVLDRCDARLDHLERGVARVQIRVDVAFRQAPGNPKLQRQVGTAELNGRHTDMMVIIDETGHDDMTAVTQDLVRLVAVGEILLGTCLGDPAIALEDCAVLNDLCLVLVIIEHPANYVLTENQ